MAVAVTLFRGRFQLYFGLEPRMEKRFLRQGGQRRERFERKRESEDELTD